MAEGGRDGGWERELPRGRIAAGRSGLALVVERVPALRAGSLVRAGGEATPASARLPRPLRGRRRDWASRPRRCPARPGGLAEALWQVRLERPPDQDEAPSVSAAPPRARGGGGGQC